MPAMPVLTETPEQAILALVVTRGETASICPSEAARALAAARGHPDAWRRYLAEIRRAGVRLAADGQIDILRKGKPIPAGAIRGVVRFRVRPAGGSS